MLAEYDDDGYGDEDYGAEEDRDKVAGPDTVIGKLYEVMAPWRVDS